MCINGGGLFASIFYSREGLTMRQVNTGHSIGAIRKLSAFWCSSASFFHLLTYAQLSLMASEIIPMSPQAIVWQYCKAHQHIHSNALG
jgi:hypothetical protein